MDKPERIGKYEVVSQIATGGFGVIYRGRDPYIKRTVAIKLCATPDEEVRQRFFHEAQFVGNLVHPNITLVFDFGIEDEVPYIVQEFLTGYDLDEMLKAGVMASPKVVLALLIQVCQGLGFAHSRGIVHRDIKPSNIRILEDGVVKIMDFGIAKSLIGETKLTQTGIALGTAGYLSPEQIQGVDVDPRTDIFSLGVVGYELITRKRPFVGNSLSNVLYNILNEDPPPPRELTDWCPESLELAILRCLAKDPAQRFQSAQELEAALRSIAIEVAAPEAFTDEQTTTVLRDVMAKMESLAPKEDGAEASTRSMDETAGPTTPQHTAIDHSPSVEDHGRSRRSPIMTIFLVLLLLVVAGAGLLYFSPQAQNAVFGPGGAPWVPTPTPTPTATPTPLPTPTATPTPAVSPTPSVTPTPAPTPTPSGPVTVRLVVDPPALLDIDGKPLREGKVQSETVSLSQGRHTFTISLPGFPEQVVERTVTWQTGVVSLTLEVGLLTLVYADPSVPKGGVAFLDGESLGQLPLIKAKVAAGEHRLSIRWPGGEKFEETITIPRLPAPPLMKPVAPQE